MYVVESLQDKHIRQFLPACFPRLRYFIEHLKANNIQSSSFSMPYTSFSTGYRDTRACLEMDVQISDEESASTTFPESYTNRERCPDNLCAHIRWPYFGDEGERRGVYNLLHGPCKFCDAEIKTEPLCNFCRHLRLYHLIVCVHPYLGELWINLDLGSNTRASGIPRIVSTKDCVLCCLLAKAIRSFLVTSGQDRDVIRIETSLNLAMSPYSGHGTLILHLDTPSEHDTIGIPFTPFSTTPEPLIRGRIDWDQIQQRLLICRNHHDDCMRSSPSEIPQGFRLIDVKNRNLVSGFRGDLRLGIHIKFVALSYVWGRAPVSADNALQSSNKDKLTTVGGLKEEHVPRAISDAMTICQKLGRRFLWVDRFCIQQDDNGPAKQAQINAMGDIFSSAEFTIIHASGSSMEDPIAGVSNTREVLQSKMALHGIEFTSGYPDFTTALKASKWNTRGWTYQEAVLSRRKLFFTPLEVRFECDDGYDSCWREEQCSKRGDGTMDKVDMAQYRLQAYEPVETVFREFTRHLESYTTRPLSHQSDILNAFTGISTALYQGDLGIYGLPEANFEQAMLWYCETKYLREVGGTMAWPSWSWASVSEIAPAAPIRYEEKDFMGTLTRWAYQDQDGELKAVKQRGNHQLFPDWRPVTYIPPQAYILVAWWKGCIEDSIPDAISDTIPEILKLGSETLLASYEPPFPPHGPTFEKIWEHLQLRQHCPICELYITHRWPSLDDIWDDIQKSRKSGTNELQCLSSGQREEDRAIIENLRPGVVLTRAQTAHFTLSRGMGEQDPDFGRDLYIMDSERRRIGIIRANGMTMTEESLAGLFELVGISISESTELGEAWSPPSVSSSGPGVDVLLINWAEGSPFARRMGVGWVFIEDWVKADREFKTVGLE